MKSHMSHMSYDVTGKNGYFFAFSYDRNGSYAVFRVTRDKHDGIQINRIN